MRIKFDRIGRALAWHNQIKYIDQRIIMGNMTTFPVGFSKTVHIYLNVNFTKVCSSGFVVTC